MIAASNIFFYCKIYKSQVLLGLFKNLSFILIEANDRKLLDSIVMICDIYERPYWQNFVVWLTW